MNPQKIPSMSSLLKLDIFKGYKIIAGSNALSNQVSYITVMDVPDIVTWLHGGEILLSAKLFDATVSAEFLLELSKKSVAAVVTKPLYTTKMTPALIELCDTVGLPIIEVPANISWTDLITPITKLLLQAQYDYIYESQKFHSSLMKYMIKGESFEQLCSDIHEDFGMSIAVTDPFFSLLGGSKNIPWKAIVESFNLQKAFFVNGVGKNADGEKVLSGYIYESELLNSTNKVAFIFPISQTGITYGYIFFLTQADSKYITAADSMRLEQIALVFSLNFAKMQEINNITRRYNNLLLDRIMNQKAMSENDLHDIEKSLNVQLAHSYCLALADKKAAGSSITSQSMQIPYLFRLIKADPLLKNVLCFERSDHLCFFVPDDEQPMRLVMEKLFNLCHQEVLSSLLVAGETTHNEFSKSYRQAFRAINFLSKNKSSGYYLYSDLGFLRLFIDRSGNVDTMFLEDLLIRYIYPLQAFDQKNNGQLEITLRTFLANNQNVKKTYEELFIHKNTLYSRLTKASEILHCDFSSSEDIFNIQLALKISDILKIIHA